MRQRNMHFRELTRHQLEHIQQATERLRRRYIAQQRHNELRYARGMLAEEATWPCKMRTVMVLESALFLEELLSLRSNC